jgi:hypothetical protein
MYRVDHFTGSQTLEAPTLPLTNTGLYFTGGDPSSTPQVPATIVEPEWLNMIQEELCNIVFEAGEELDKSDRAQITRCIQIVGNPGGSGPGGPRMFEPPDTGTPYSRLYSGTTGRWVDAIEEPPDDGRGYSRARRQGEDIGVWIAVAGQGRAIGDMAFYVRRGGDNANDGLTPATAWEDIQYAIDALCDGLDAGGFIITLDVGDDGGTPWEGFVVTRFLINAPEMGFRIVGSSSTGANRLNCRLGPSPLAGYEGYAIYATSTRVSIAGFTFQAPPSQVPHSGAYICAEGNDTTLWIESEVSAYGNRSNNPLLFARAGAHIIIDGELIVADNLFTPNSGIVGGPDADGTYKGMFAADETGQIIIEDSRNGELGITKPRGAIQSEGISKTGRILYANRGGVIDFGEEGGLLPRPPAVGGWGSAVVIKATGVLTAGRRGIMSNTRPGAVPIYYGMLATGAYSAGSHKLQGAGGGGSDHNWANEQWTSGAIAGGDPGTAPP